MKMRHVSCISGPYAIIKIMLKLMSLHFVSKYMYSTDQSKVKFFRLQFTVNSLSTRQL